mmetsp:Transcript_21393/g.60596  ORF Transcript_21393/g.60596 Transcript_21393/m.60596 type:complete len:251 (-) Transcript_21393:816-1568(-)
MANCFVPGLRLDCVLPQAPGLPAWYLQPRRVRLAEELPGHAAKLLQLRLQHGQGQIGRRGRLPAARTGVADRVEEVVRPQGLLPRLLVAEDQVDPSRQVPGGALTLQRRAHLADKVCDILCPVRQLHVEQWPLGGCDAKRVQEPVSGQDEELRDELHQRGRAVVDGLPGLRQGAEEPRHGIEMPVVKPQHPLWHRAQKPVDHVGRRRVVRAVEKPLLLRHAHHPLPEVLQALGREGPNWLAEVPIDGWVI